MIEGLYLILTSWLLPLGGVNLPMWFKVLNTALGASLFILELITIIKIEKYLKSSN